MNPSRRALGVSEAHKFFFCFLCILYKYRECVSEILSRIRLPTPDPDPKPELIGLPTPAVDPTRIRLPTPDPDPKPERIRLPTPDAVDPARIRLPTPDPDPKPELIGARIRLPTPDPDPKPGEAIDSLPKKYQLDADSI
ncbi:hypothetical protein C8J57DRAFT_1461675 [Mycena rebaudengoi]|nr:hypothetical protein C8J57DRAFT_1461675 [Mycena rebaudengoi]